MNAHLLQNDWDGEVLELHSKPKLSPVAIPKKVVKKKIPDSAAVEPILRQADATQIHEEVKHLSYEKSLTALPTHDREISQPIMDVADANLAPKQQGLYTEDIRQDSKQTKTAESDIKKAFVNALAAPIPGGVDPQMVAQVEAARKVLGIQSTGISAAEHAPFPPTYDNSVDMKAAFTRALESPMPQIQLTDDRIAGSITQNGLQIQKNLSNELAQDKSDSLDIVSKLTQPHFTQINHLNIAAKKSVKKPEALVQVEQVMASAPAIVIAPTGTPTAPEVRHTRTITKFAPKAHLSGGWSETSDNSAEIDKPIESTPAATQKPYTIDEATEPKA